MTTVQRLARSSPVHGAFAALMLGGWAVFANAAHPWPAPLIAGLVQGALSACIALGQKAIIERTLARITPTRTGATVWPVLISGTFSLVVIVTLHTLARTPELLATISLPWTMGLIYSTLYTLTLQRQSKVPR